MREPSPTPEFFDTPLSQAAIAESRRRVLVIDDSVLIREAVKVALGRIAGWTVIGASSGEEGIAMAANQSPEAILLDVSMPGMDGTAVVERLREMPALRSIPVVLLTGKDRPEDHERFEELELAGVISKPFEIESLASELARLLGWTV